MYPGVVSPVPTETGYNGQSLERASSIGEIAYDHQDAHAFVSNGYNDSNVNGGSVATSPAPYDTNGYNGNGYMGYSDNGSLFSTNINGNGCDENGSAVSGYAGNKNVRRRLLPAIPKGEKQQKRAQCTALNMCGWAVLNPDHFQVVDQPLTSSV